MQSACFEVVRSTLKTIQMRILCAADALYFIFLTYTKQFITAQMTYNNINPGFAEIHHCN